MLKHTRKKLEVKNTRKKVDRQIPAKINDVFSDELEHQ